MQFSSGQITSALRGYPPATLAAAQAFETSPSLATLAPLVDNVLDFLLPPDDTRPPLSTMDEDTRLVADLGIDSMAIVELNHQLEDLFSAKLADPTIRSISTLKNLREAVWQLVNES
jgi:acyl carrier protein